MFVNVKSFQPMKENFEILLLSGKQGSNVDITIGNNDLC